VDLYGNRIENQYGEYYVTSPSVLFDPEELESYLIDQGLTPEDAEAVAEGQLGIPMGTISPDQDGSADLLLVVDQGGSLEYWGADIATDLMLNKQFTFSATYSYVDETVFYNEEMGEQIFSIPRNKCSAGLTYRNLIRGIDGNIQWRWVESYPVASGMFRGVIETYNLLDIGLGYRFYWAPDMRITLNAYNLFDNRHREFPNTPELGRLVVARLQVTF
jgi:iron complex outermembrane receptor protein